MVDRTMLKSIWDIPPKTCPVCAKKVNRRQGDKATNLKHCPSCGATLFSYRVKRRGIVYTIWVTNHPSIKTLALLIRGKIRTACHMPEYDFVDPAREMGMAHVLLDRCDGNQALAFEVINCIYDNDARHEVGIFGGVRNMPRSPSQLVCSAKNIEFTPLLALAKQRIGYRRADVKAQDAPKQLGLNLDV